MPQSQSSVLAELGWLAYFLAVFVILAYLLLRFVVPHHFNDRVAVMLAAILSGVAWTATRAVWRRR